MGWADYVGNNLHDVTDAFFQGLELSILGWEIHRDLEGESGESGVWGGTSAVYDAIEYML